jgi:molybdopterin converting factor small subunit
VENATVTVELYGIPRLRAGVAERTVPAGSAADVLAAVVRACPGLADVVTPDGRLSPHYLLALDGRRFFTDLAQPLAPGSRVLLLSADAGG